MDVHNWESSRHLPPHPTVCCWRRRMTSVSRVIRACSLVRRVTRVTMTVSTVHGPPEAPGVLRRPTRLLLLLLRRPARRRLRCQDPWPRSFGGNLRSRAGRLLNLALTILQRRRCRRCQKRQSSMEGARKAERRRPLRHHPLRRLRRLQVAWWDWGSRELEAHPLLHHRLHHRLRLQECAWQSPAQAEARRPRHRHRHHQDPAWEYLPPWSAPRLRLRHPRRAAAPTRRSVRNRALRGSPLCLAPASTTCARTSRSRRASR